MNRIATNTLITSIFLNVILLFVIGYFVSSQESVEAIEKGGHGSVGETEDKKSIGGNKSTALVNDIEPLEREARTSIDKVSDKKNIGGLKSTALEKDAEPLEKEVNVSIGKENKKNTDGLKSITLEKGMVSGLPNYSGNNLFHRLPDYMEQSLRPILWDLSKEPSGARIRFTTKSKVVKVNAFSPNPATPHHMNSIMKNGMDIYVDNRYVGSAWPDKDGKIEKLFKLDSSSDKHVTIYLPLYEEITIESIQIQELTQANISDDLKDIQPVVYYGSSITQGAVASNPGMSYPAIISRATGIDFVNLGFSGNGLGDAEIAQYISTLNASLIVLDYWANPSSEVYKNTLPNFVNLIRERHKTTPILVISPFYTVNRDKAQKEKRKIAFDFVSERRKGGDSNIYFFDGMNMISKDTAFALADGLHPNSLGFWLSANALIPKIREIIDID